ncbi:MAG: hypothetical protein LBV78_16720 [Kitasatospora sp.]|jgi:hypothetical protein|nr:hypothetical protein [Kitasatospora sp.]
MPEQELSDVFVRAVGGSAPDLGLLVAGATAEGRAIRVRRRLALAGAVAVVAALAVGGGLLLRPGAGPGPSAVTAAGPGSGPGAGLGPGSGGPSAVPVPSVTKARPVVLDRLLVFVPDLVLDGWSEEGSIADGARTDTVLARLRTASGADAGTVEVHVQQPGGTPRDTGESYDCRDHRDTEECAPVTGEDTGGVLLALSDQQHRTTYRADLLDHHGVRTVLTATGPAGGDPPLDRDRLAKAAAGLTAPPTGAEEEQARESARQQALTAATGPSAFPSAAPSATRPPGAVG